MNPQKRIIHTAMVLEAKAQAEEVGCAMNKLLMMLGAEPDGDPVPLRMVARCPHNWRDNCPDCGRAPYYTVADGHEHTTLLKRRKR